MTENESGWEFEAARDILKLYVSDLLERREKKTMDIEALIEAYLYVVGRLKASLGELDQIVASVEQQQAQAAAQAAQQQAMQQQAQAGQPVQGYSNLPQEGSYNPQQNVQNVQGQDIGLDTQKKLDKSLIDSVRR